MEFQVSRAGCTLQCTANGQGPLLLLIHGAGVDASFFTEAVNYLKTTYTVLTYHRCGYTTSKFDDPEAMTRERFSPRQQALDAIAVVDAFSREYACKPSLALDADSDQLAHQGNAAQGECSASAIVMGISAGGVIGLELANEYPEYVDKLLVYEPPVAVISPFYENLVQIRKSMRMHADNRQIVRAMKVLLDMMNGTDPLAQEKTLAQSAQNLKNFRVFLKYELEDTFTYWDNVKDRLKLTVPRAWGAGDRDGITYPVESARANAQAFGCEFSVVNGYHNFPEDRPEAFANWVCDMIKKL